MADAKPRQRPEGRLIAEALKLSGRSANKAAEEAGISATRWRHIVNGYQPLGGNQFATVVGPADTVARMAKVVNLSAEELREAGRGDAAERLRAMTRLRVVDSPDGERRREEILNRLIEVSREMTVLSEELAALGPSSTAGAWAAYSTGTPSSREALDRAQDEAGEAPDAPGPEHGA